MTIHSMGKTQQVKPQNILEQTMVVSSAIHGVTLLKSKTWELPRCLWMWGVISEPLKEVQELTLKN